MLFVGTLEPRKNLAVWSRRSAGWRTDHVLAVVGPTAGATPARPPRTGSGCSASCPTATCAALYAGADVFVYPSLREGFGLPVAEAMAHGAPVVTSRGTSTEEVAGGAAVLVDPTDVDAIVGRHRGGRSPTATAWSAAGRARAAELTWERTADATLAAYRGGPRRE